MKKHFSLLLIIAFALICQTNNLFAQGGKHEAKAFLNRTNGIIMKAKGAVEVGKVYTGDVVKAVHHQKYARQMFKEGKYMKAIHHSYRARLLAFEAIKANKAAVSDDMQLSKEEKPLIEKVPDNKVLDSEVKIPQNVKDESLLKEKEEDVKEK